jgi:hypothetical protein
MVKREEVAKQVWDPKRESKPAYDTLPDKHERVDMGPASKRKRTNKSDKR